MTQTSHKLFVGGLPVRVDKDVIVRFFEKYGTVLNCKLKKNQQTGRSLGFAYLHVKDREVYDRLLAETVEFHGRVIEIKPVWTKKELAERLEDEKKKKLFVSNLPLNTTNGDLISYFEYFGEVSNGFIIKDPDTQQNKTYGYVIFKEIEGYERAFGYSKPHIFKEGVRINLEGCLQANEIARLKQQDRSHFRVADSFPSERQVNLPAATKRPKREEQLGDRQQASIYKCKGPQVQDVQKRQAKHSDSSSWE